MSRIGKKPVQIPEGVTVDISGNNIKVTGPKGELSFNYDPSIKVELKENEVMLTVAQSSKKVSAIWGLTRALINNLVEGVTKGYEKKLELVGVGYRVKSEGSGISLSLGYSHPVVYNPPEGITLKVEDNQNLIIEGIDKQLVGQVAAKIRSYRKPEPYKGKGIRYVGEVVKRKPGKAAKA